MELEIHFYCKKLLRILSLKNKENPSSKHWEYFPLENPITD